jgi:hypothetical protein
MAQNERELRLRDGKTGISTYMSLYKEGMTEQESTRALHRFRGANKMCRRVEDKRIGMWMPSLGRYFYCVYVQTPKESL